MQARSPGAGEGSLVPVLLLGLVVEVVDFVLVVDFFFVVVFAIVVVFVVVFVVSRFEFDGRSAGHFEIGAAVRAADQVPFVDVELVDLDLGVTFRAGGHTCSWRTSPSCTVPRKSLMRRTLSR